jgi:hypothetical protein
MARSVPSCAAYALVFGALVTGTAAAADRVILGTRLVVRDSAAGESDRRVVIVGHETGTDVPAVSDPTAGGATLTVIANGGTSSVEAFALGAAGWSALGSTGFRYVGPTDADGDPVKRVVIKRTAGGAALIRVLLRGNVGSQPLAVVPPNPGAEGGFVLDVAGGDRYCVKLGGAAGGTEKEDAASTWKIVHAAAEDGCPTVATTTSTSSTSTTSTSTTTSTTVILPPGCGNDQLDPGEWCDGTAFIPDCDPSLAHCIPPGQPGECTCCNNGAFCSLYSMVPCCGGATCAPSAGGGGVCLSCSPGAICADLSIPAFQDCCEGAVCGRPVLPFLYCCLPVGQPCFTGNDCCSGSCNPAGVCECSPPGHACTPTSLDNSCCSGSCTAFTCD